MPSCAAIGSLVTAYVDGQLGPADCRLVDQHIEVCAACRSRLLEERTVRNLLCSRRAELRAAQAPEGLRARCVAARAGSRIAAFPARLATRPRWSIRLRPLAVAALFLLVIGGAAGYRASLGPTEAMAAELAADHVKCFLMNSVLGTHDSVADVESRMRSRFNWAARLPAEPAQADMELVGSRPCLYEHGMVAHIMYRHHGAPVSIYMVPGTVRRRDLLRAFGHEAVIWSDAQRTFVLIANAPRAEVEKVATFVQASLR